MHWIHDFQLFLFDFDGLLVNTEEIHFQAYKRMCQGRGCNLDWDFNQYCKAAHYTAEGLKNAIYSYFPELYKKEPVWEVLYAEKKQAILDLLNEGAVHPMPGVEKLLAALHKAGIVHCVVTHSADDLVNVVRKKNPALDSIPYWFTREHYSHPKPHPECYQKAIEKLAKPGDKIIGFEDTPRGLEALLATKALPVLICQADYPEIPAFIKKGAQHFPNFESIKEVVHS